MPLRALGFFRHRRYRIMASGYLVVMPLRALGFFRQMFGVEADTLTKSQVVMPLRALGLFRRRVMVASFPFASIM